MRSSSFVSARKEEVTSLSQEAKLQGGELRPHLYETYYPYGLWNNKFLYDILIKNILTILFEVINSLNIIM